MTTMALLWATFEVQIQFYQYPEFLSLHTVHFTTAQMGSNNPIF